MAFTEYKNGDAAAKALRKKAGKYIKDLRKGRDLTQSGLSKLLRLEYYTFISQVENGFARVPPESYRDWANALGVDVSEFAKKLLSYYDPHTYGAIFQSK